MASSLNRRALLLGAGASLLSACARKTYVFTIQTGMDHNKVLLKNEAGSETWVYREQVFVHDESGKLVALPDLGRSLREGDRVTAILPIVRQASDGAKAMIITLDVITLSAAIAVAVFTFGTGAVAVSYAYISPNILDYKRRESTPSTFLKPNPAASIRGDWDNPTFENLEPTDVVAFYRRGGEDKVHGPVTTSNIWPLHLWADEREAIRLNMRIVDLLGQAYAIYGSEHVRDLLIGYSHEAILYRKRQIFPLSMRIVSRRKSSHDGGHVRFRLLYENQFGPDLDDVLIATRIPKTLNVVAASESASLRHRVIPSEDAHNVHFWRLGRVRLADKGKLAWRVQVDLFD